DPKLYFYGVARNVLKESPKRVKKQVSLEDTTLATPEAELEDESASMLEECLNSCLQQLSPEKRQLILAYYAKEKQAKIDHRTEITRELGISIEALRVRVHRIRLTLEKCIERCLHRLDQKR